MGFNPYYQACLNLVISLIAALLLLLSVIACGMYKWCVKIKDYCRYHPVDLVLIIDD